MYIEVSKIQEMEHQENGQNISTRQLEEGMVGRCREFQEIQQYIESNNVPVVLLTGGPGFGKSTLAKAVAHELARPENKVTVLFCSLVSKKTFREAVIEMVNSCAQGTVQLTEKPDQWLKEWSRQIQTRFTFVLDNADDVLMSDERDKFLSTLKAVRESSGRKGTFLITSRVEFHSQVLPSKLMHLGPLSLDEATRLLLSRVADDKIRGNLCQTEEITRLCGYAPLALCISGSQSSRYQMHPLICSFVKKVGVNKSDLLQEGEQRACSFFMSRLRENSKMFWKKYASKGAMESFQVERHNFEHFLKVYAEGIRSRNQNITDNCKEFLEKFLETCCYLQMCLSPCCYVQFLVTMLQSFNRLRRIRCSAQNRADVSSRTRNAKTGPKGKVHRVF